MFPISTVSSMPEEATVPTTTNVPTFTVLSLRFTDDPPALIRFLRTVGMAPAVTTESDGFAEMVAGGGGRVMVHNTAGAETGSAAGETHLCLSVPVVEEAAAHLHRAGHEVRVWDESYGKQGVLRGPRGEDIPLNELQHDLYGYRGHEGGEADERLRVTAVRPSAGAERDRDIDFFSAAGFAAADDGNEWWLALAAPQAGLIGLHAPAAGESASRPTGTEFGDVALVRLGFATTEDLDALAARLDEAGYDARRVDQHGTSAVHVTDPDGQHLEIHSAPQS